MKYILSLFCGVFFLLPCFAFADVRINEVAWMGTASSQYSEWIELYNSASNEVSLAGWKLYKTGNVVLFTLNKTIAAGGYLLIERTTASAPDAVPGIDDEAGTFGGGGLRNSGEDLILKDTDGNTVDSLLFSSGWPAGDAKTKETMQWEGQKWITAVATPDQPNASLPTTSSSTESSIVSNSEQSPQTVAPVVTEIPTDTDTASPVEADPTPDPITPPATAVTVPASTTPVTPSSTPIIPPAGEIITAPAAPTTVKQTHKPSVKKSSSISPGNNEPDATVNSMADQLQDSSDTAPKENNHIKVIILAVVAFIGLVLLLLLGRLRVSQE